MQALSPTPVQLQLDYVQTITLKVCQKGQAAVIVQQFLGTLCTL